MADSRTTTKSLNKESWDSLLDFGFSTGLRENSGGDVVPEEGIVEAVFDLAGFHQRRRLLHQCVALHDLILDIVVHLVVGEVALEELNMVQRGVQRPFDLKQVTPVGLELVEVKHPLESIDVLPDLIGFVFEHSSITNVRILGVNEKLSGQFA